MSSTGHFIPPLLVFPKKNIKQELMNGTPPGSIHAYHPSGWIQSEIFSPVVSSFYQTYKVDKKRSCYLSTGFGTIHTPGNWRALLLFERIVLTSFASHLTAATKCNPWIKLSWGP